MKATVYIETTVVSYLAARPSRDIVRLAHQRQTRDWWNKRRDDFQIVCSEVVIREASAGDPTAAEERMVFLRDIPLLAVTAGAADLATELVARIPLPKRAMTDALHVAVAATNGVDYLLTWNCRHLTNAIFRPRIEKVCLAFGLEPPVLCDPSELMEEF